MAEVDRRGRAAHLVQALRDGRGLLLDEILDRSSVIEVVELPLGQRREEYDHRHAAQEHLCKETDLVDEDP